MKRTAVWLLVLAICLAVVPLSPSQPARAAESQPTPSTVFNLVVSLEWQPGANDSLPNDLLASGCRDTTAVATSYVKDLIAALRSTSAYLYRYSRGQMAFGRVEIYTGARNWDRAHIRVLADNSYRPAAHVGGIVDGTRFPVPMTYTSSTGRTQVFYPGRIYLGRLWNGGGARCGAWSRANGWRTIGHEWAHYALFLYDEYFNQSTMSEQYCTTGDRWLPSIPADDTSIKTTDSLMAYHYRAAQLWLRSVPAPPAACDGTPQWHVHHASDWETVPRFYSEITMPDAPAAGPVFAGSPAESLFVALIDPASPPPPPAPARTSAKITVAVLPDASLVGASYLIRSGTDGIPRRIIGQGLVVPGRRLAQVFWGTRPDWGDRAAVIVQHPSTGARYTYPADSRTPTPLRLDSSNHITPTTGAWRPGLRIVPMLMGDKAHSRVTGLRVEVNDCAFKTQRLELRYCPAGGTCGAPVDLPLVSGAAQHTFSFSGTGVEPPAPHGYIHVRVPATGQETVATYQIAGGVGPAIIDGHAPFAEGEVSLEVEAKAAPLPATADSRLLYSTAQQCTATPRGMPTGVTIVGVPVSVEPVKSNPNGGQAWSTADPPLHIRLSYNQDLLDQLGLTDENRLVLLRLSAQNTWDPVPIAGRSNALDWIASAPQSFAGKGAIFALGYK
jgi:hypothetical protein